MNLNPYMMILKADPARYIQKPASTLLVLLKTAEGLCCLLGLFRLGAFLFDSLDVLTGSTVTTAELLITYLPGNLGQTIVAAQSGAASLLLVLGALCVVIALICTVLEAAVLWALRFALTGAAFLKQVQKVLYLDTLLLCILTCCELGLRIFVYVSTELQNDPSFRLFRLILIVGGVFAALLALLTAYQKDILTVLSAIEYEFRMEFKETFIDAPVLGKYSILLGLIFLGGGIFSGHQFGYQSPLVLLLLAEAVKFFLVRLSWADFQRCHR